jgi:hypothetical protein
MRIVCTFLLTVLTSFSAFSLLAQQTTIPTDPKALRKFKAGVLNNTDHTYFGIEGGILLNFGPTNLNKGKHDYIEKGCIAFGQQESRDIGFLLNPRFFAGYAFKKHYFEGVMGGMNDRTNFCLKDSLLNNILSFSTFNSYSTIGFRYMYNYTPFKSNVIKMLIGPEVGYAVRNLNANNFFGSLSFTTAPQIIYFDTINGTQVQIQNNNMHVHQFYVGINSRFDFKVKKNLTIFINGLFQAIIQNGEMYRTSLKFPGGTEYVAVPAGSGINMNFNAGLKFDFFSSKKKRETYDKLGIEDPFRDK